MLQGPLLAVRLKAMEQCVGDFQATIACDAQRCAQGL